MPGVYKISMVRMTEMSDKSANVRVYKYVPQKYGNPVKGKLVRYSKNSRYEIP